MYLCFQAGKLSGEEKTKALEPLQSAGWTMVKDREAIYKEFLFKDFNEVYMKKKKQYNKL